MKLTFGKPSEQPLNNVSLHRRLIRILLGLTLFSWLISVIVTAVNAQLLIYHQIDQQLEEYMAISRYTLSIVMETENVRDYFRTQTPITKEGEHLTRVTGYGSQGTENATNVWFHDEQILVGANTPPFPFPQRSGFKTLTVENAEGEHQWRVLYRYEPRFESWLAVGFNMDRAEQISSTTFARVMIPLLIVLPITLFILMAGIRRGLAPLNTVAERIAHRSAFDLEPISQDRVPHELMPLVRSLNLLMERLKLTLTSEQRFTANAAHELQTPLTAIKTEVQRCQREVESDSARDMLARIASRVDRAANTVKQLLTLARLDPDQELTFDAVDIDNLLLEALAEHGSEAVARGLNLKLTEPGRPVLIHGQRDWLNILLHNLLLNAMRHATAGGELEIALIDNSTTVMLSIANDAPPLDDDELSQLTTRFFRGNNPAANGSGLGLSIVKRIVELHNATMTMSHWHNRQGFQVIVSFEREARPNP